jgi:hypothetical protein
MSVRSLERASDDEQEKMTWTFLASNFAFVVIENVRRIDQPRRCKHKIMWHKSSS